MAKRTSSKATEIAGACVASPGRSIFQLALAAKRSNGITGSSNTPGSSMLPPSRASRAVPPDSVAATVTSALRQPGRPLREPGAMAPAAIEKPETVALTRYKAGAASGPVQRASSWRTTPSGW